MNNQYNKILILSVLLIGIFYFSGCTEIPTSTPWGNGTYKFTLKCKHQAVQITYNYIDHEDVGLMQNNILNLINTNATHFTAFIQNSRLYTEDKCKEGCPVEVIEDWPIKTPADQSFFWDPNSPNIGNNYYSAIISLKNSASGLSYVNGNNGRIRFGTSTFIANVNTYAGQTPRQILDDAKVQLIANGFQNVSVNTQNDSVFNITFRIDPVQDSSVTYAFDDTGVSPSIRYDCSCLECDSCVVIGPEHIPIYSTGILYKEDSKRGGWWNLINYTAHASIEWQNDSIISVSAGNVGGYFLICYEVLILPDSVYETCCKYIYVDDPLPVELSNFTTVVTRSDIILDWTTASEENNSGFEIQRSSKDQIWSAAGFVKGAGNSAEPNSYTFIDRNLNSGIYNYRLKQIDFNGNFKFYDLSNEVVIGVPNKFSLLQNFPNPFNPVTKIRYDIPISGNVSMKIYDNIGREVKSIINEFKDAGYYTVEFNGSNLASGIYYYKLETGNFTATKKMVLLK